MNTHANVEHCAPEAQRFPETQKLIARWKKLKERGLVDIKTYPFLYDHSTAESFSESVNAILDADPVAHPMGIFPDGKSVFSNRA